jgi:hypothetical protein
MFLCVVIGFGKLTAIREGTGWGGNKTGPGYNLLLEIALPKYFALCICYGVFHFDVSVSKH